MPPNISDVVARLDSLEQLIKRFRPNADPAPDDLGRVGVGGIQWQIPGPFHPGDPAPIDISRFSKVQLQVSLHQVAAERIRLDALEGTLKEQLAAHGG
jgi:hypothetical protein